MDLQLSMDLHVSKYITYYFDNILNQILKLSFEIIFQFHSNYLFIPFCFVSFVCSYDPDYEHP